MTALLFSSVGYIYDRTHTKLIPELGGLSRVMPVASAFFIVAALAGMGVPGLANFWGELVVFVAAFKTYPVSWHYCRACARCLRSFHAARRAADLLRP